MSGVTEIEELDAVALNWRDSYPDQEVNAA
jgi:hypothetical protein